MFVTDRQIGGSTFEDELDGLEAARIAADAPGLVDFTERVAKCRLLMAKHDVTHLVLTAGSNLEYFTGVHWHPSERLLCAIVYQNGTIEWVAPRFEAPRLESMLSAPAQIHSWEEEQDPFALLSAQIRATASRGVRCALDETAPFAFAARLKSALAPAEVFPANAITDQCRSIKSSKEIAAISAVMLMTLEVQRRAAKILRAGITANEVIEFIDKAHRRLTGKGSTFCIVSFGDQTAFPHGGRPDQVLKEGDMVLIDTGTDLHGYKSDLTRSYVFGEPTLRQREIWDVERKAQYAAFDAAQVGVPCEIVDHAARNVIIDHGLGPDYEIPGLPHRTGHGLGLDLHEHPYIVRGNSTPLAPGMCFSNEPMICIYGEFGVRLEDHVYITENGPAWFTEPAVSIDRPFRPVKFGSD